MLPGGSLTAAFVEVYPQRQQTLRNRNTGTNGRGKEMRKAFARAIVGLAVVLVFSSMASAQTKSQVNPWKFDPQYVAVGDGGPAPKHDLNGTWAGPGSSPAVPRGAQGEKPSMTP